MAKTKAPRLGAESFWEMAALANAGQLASCPSCVEYFYFQSKQNAVAFLESCTASGLVVEVSLLDLLGDVGTRTSPTLRQRWYDQPIYISAGDFRSRNLDSARQRIESTRSAVHRAFRLYYEALGADDAAISAAYINAIENEKLRHSDIAKARNDVDFSPVAKLRLILDGFRYAASNDNLGWSLNELEERTAAYVLEFAGQRGPALTVWDHSSELDDFIIGFLSERQEIKDFWSDKFGPPPSAFRLQWLPVIGALIRHRCDDIFRLVGRESSFQFAARMTSEVRQACDRAADEAYKNALTDLSEDLEAYRYEYGSMPSPETTAQVQPSMDSRY